MAGGEVRLGNLADIPDGDARGFDPFQSGRDTMLVVRQGTQVFGWRDSCPHIDGAPMAWRKNAYLNRQHDRIVCSAHGALFDIATGECTVGPCLGQSLERVLLRVGADGSVYLLPPPPASDRR